MDDSDDMATDTNDDIVIGVTHASPRRKTKNKKFAFRFYK